MLSRSDFADYPVTAEQLDALNKDAGTYNDNLGDNKMIDKDSSIASAKIDTLLANNRLILAKLDKLVNYFKDTDPGFVEGFRKAAAVNNSGIRHSGSKGIITNNTTEQPIEKVSVTLSGKTNSKSTVTNSDGAWEIIKFIPGKCKLTFTAPGYETRTVEVTIVRGKILELNIKLQAQSMNMETA